VVWYSSPEEKKEIIDIYKAKLRSIDCKHFNFGNGNCPFGASCFYKVCIFLYSLLSGKAADE
jgi:E3 ubiquitin-protein ligase makorin